MLTVHHLESSRSHRIVWLLEELDLPFNVVGYKRDPVTQFAPTALRSAHPLGKSPILEDNGHSVIESGAIIAYILSRYGHGRLAPREDSDQWIEYVQWMHYAEGSAIMPLRLMFYAQTLGESAAPLQPRIASELNAHFGYIETRLSKTGYFVGDSFSAADIQMATVLEGGESARILSPYPAITSFLSRMRARPAYLRAIDKGSALNYGLQR